MNILVCDGMDPGKIQELEALGHQVESRHYEAWELLEKVGDYDVLIVRSATEIREALIDRALKAGRLKMIIRGGIGLDNIDVAYAEAKGIRVRNTPNSSASAVAELVLGAMIALSRFVIPANLTMREGAWNKKLYTGTEIAGKTLGLLGFGRIAKEVAKRALAMGMRVYYFNRRGEDPNYPECHYRGYRELLQEADYVSIHMPGGEETRGMLGATEFEIMRKSAFLINYGRGGIVDEDALVQALEEEEIAGAALDVFLGEPGVDQRLLQSDKILLTPHIGGATREAQARIGAEIVEHIKELSHE